MNSTLLNKMQKAKISVVINIGFLFSQRIYESLSLCLTPVYAHADTEHKRKAITAATPPGNPLYAKLSLERFTITDENASQTFDEAKIVRKYYQHISKPIG